MEIKNGEYLRHRDLIYKNHPINGSSIVNCNPVIDYYACLQNGLT